MFVEQEQPATNSHRNSRCIVKMKRGCASHEEHPELKNKIKVCEMKKRAGMRCRHMGESVLKRNFLSGSSGSLSIGGGSVEAGDGLRIGRAFVDGALHDGAAL